MRPPICFFTPDSPNYAVGGTLTRVSFMPGLSGSCSLRRTRRTTSTGADYGLLSFYAHEEKNYIATAVADLLLQILRGCPPPAIASHPYMWDKAWGTIAAS